MKKDQAPTPQPTKSQTEAELNDDGQPLDKFGEMIAVMDIEHLLRFRKRLEMVGRKKMVKILTYEIKARNAVEKKQAEIQRQEAEIYRLQHKLRQNEEPTP